MSKSPRLTAIAKTLRYLAVPTIAASGVIIGVLLALFGPLTPESAWDKLGRPDTTMLAALAALLGSAALAIGITAVIAIKQASKDPAGE